MSDCIHFMPKLNAINFLSVSDGKIISIHSNNYNCTVSSKILCTSTTHGLRSRSFEFSDVWMILFLAFQPFINYSLCLRFDDRDHLFSKRLSVFKFSVAVCSLICSQLSTSLVIILVLLCWAFSFCETIKDFTCNLHSSAASRTALNFFASRGTINSMIPGPWPTALDRYALVLRTASNEPIPWALISFTNQCCVFYENWNWERHLGALSSRFPLSPLTSSWDITSHGLSNCANAALKLWWKSVSVFFFNYCLGHFHFVFNLARLNFQTLQWFPLSTLLIISCVFASMSRVTTFSTKLCAFCFFCSSRSWICSQLSSNSAIIFVLFCTCFLMRLSQIFHL